MSLLTRFAPAPTGFLHIGHVVNAVYVWGLARAGQGRVLLRIEDHDRQRCRPGFEAALLEDLAWLGFVADEVAPRQSQRDAAYRAALPPLSDAGLLYGCDCTRKEVGGPRYPGTCRDRGLPLTDDVGWRVRLEDRGERFDDLLLGPQEQDPACDFGDTLIKDRLGNWTYQWAATADDTLQSITHVIRGVDLLDSTGRQMALARLLGRRAPATFAHHPLVMKSPTQKMSKSDRDTGVRDLRNDGWTPERVIGHAAWQIGLQPQPTPLSANDVARFFARA
jgi:glutamyl-tRNA synthetase/glutamyl-Q tRNA(Asp) synthetase